MAITKYTFEDIKEYAKTKGGKVLSKDYSNCNDKVHFECKDGHQFSQWWFREVKKQNWCLQCENQKTKLLRKIKAYAKTKGGVCLSTEWTDCEAKYKWKCSKGHTWETTYDSVFHKKTWCPTCNGNNVYTVDDLKNHAKNKGGKCLSRTYKNMETKVSWECHLGHKWKSSFNTVFHKKCWCPTCAKNKNENYSIRIAEYLLGVSFRKVRPKWLQNIESNCLLELDGYNEKHNLAIEYQGFQHYEPTEIFGGISKHEYLKRCDAFKKSKLQELDIKLAEIRYFPNWVDKSPELTILKIDWVLSSLISANFPITMEIIENRYSKLVEIENLGKRYEEALMEDVF